MRLALFLSVFICAGHMPAFSQTIPEEDMQQTTTMEPAAAEEAAPVEEAASVEPAVTDAVPEEAPAAVPTEEESKSSPAVTSGEPANPEPAAVKPGLTSAEKKSAIRTDHSLQEIVYKISRAKHNLENYGDDLGGHRGPAIKALDAALAELQKAQP